MGSLKLIFVGLLFFVFFEGQCQFTTKEVLSRISSLQVTDDPFYDAGLFPSKRSWSFSRDSVEDNTVFFTASIVFTLRQIRELTSPQSQQVIDAITEKALPVYQKYKSRNGEVTYNFWQTIPPDLPFPNGGRLISNTRMRLPDDYDTTCIIAMTDGENDSTDVMIREKMVEYATREDRFENEPTTLKQYKDSKAYEVWFAKKMPQTFDICVMSNVLLFVLDRDYPLNSTDSATVSLIKEMILNDDHMNEAKYISHHATSPTLILYHVSRLLAYDDRGLLEEIRIKLKNDIDALLHSTENEMEKVLLLSSLYRLGFTSDLQPDYEKLEGDLRAFVFFSVKPFGSGFSSLKMDGISPTIDWYCEAYNRTLVFEYLVLSKKG